MRRMRRRAHPAAYPRLGTSASGFQLNATSRCLILHCFTCLSALVSCSCNEAPCDRGFRGQDAAAELPRGKATFRALYSEDGAHPSGAGTYLEACVVASAITGAFARS